MKSDKIELDSNLDPWTSTPIRSTVSNNQPDPEHEPQTEDDNINRLIKNSTLSISAPSFSTLTGDKSDHADTKIRSI